ncbi:hypothetical protein HRbin34_00260 [bacterium HR34]|nr:hypothetical protein HRbin34_00260 [bacterium HR34]
MKVLSPRSKSEDARNGDGFWEKSELQEKDREVTEARYWNENSLAFLISYGDFDALFTGDIPKYTSQPYIISRYKDLLVKTEIVGIPHHGKNGNYFNSEFAKTIGKDAAVVIGIATRDYEDVILNGYKNNNNKIIILDGKNNGRITVSIEGGSNQFTVCQSVGNICKTYSLTSSLTSGGASLSESLSESVEKCGESAYFGPNGIFQKAYISYRGKQYDTSTPFLGIYHGEGFEFVIEAKVDTDDKKKCMILLHPSSYALGYIEANGASDKQTFIKFSEDTEGSTITYRIPYRFDLYDNSGNPLVDNFKGKVNIYLFEIVQFHPEVKTTLHYRIPFATFNINIRKPEIYNFYQSNSVINIYDTNSNNDSFEIKFSFTGLKEGDEYSIYYDVDGDGSFELYDNKKYTFSHTGSSSSQEVFILCNNFTKSGANFVYKCAVDGDEPSTFFIKPSAYSGKLFVVLTDYKIDGNYYLATDHFTVPVTVCDEKSCFFGVFPKSNIEEFINSLSNFVFVLISIGAILMIIIGGFVLLTSGGNYERIQKGKKILTYAILGFVVALFANIIYALIKTIII